MYENHRFGVSPILRNMPPGYHRVGQYTLHVTKIPGLNPRGETVVFIHGIGASASSWLLMARKFVSTSKRIIAVDMPGHGLSPCPRPPFSCSQLYQILREYLIEALDPEAQNTIIGNSLGGALALRFCIDEPDLSSKCVLISPAGAPFPVSAHEILKPFYVHEQSDVSRILDMVWPNRPKISNLLCPVLFSQMTQPGYLSMLDSIVSVDDNPSSDEAKLMFSAEELKSFTKPLLLIWGEKDNILPLSMRDFFDQHLPSTTSRFFPEDVGHCPQFEKPGYMAKKILEWNQWVSTQHID